LLSSDKCTKPERTEKRRLKEREKESRKVLVRRSKGTGRKM
jgi:hypothetical protein